MTKSLVPMHRCLLRRAVRRSDLRGYYAGFRDIGLVGKESRHADHVRQAALHLAVADEDAARSADHPMNKTRFLQRREHLTRTGAAGVVPFGELAFAAELRTRLAGVDIGNDPAPQLLTLCVGTGFPPVDLAKPILTEAYTSASAWWDSGRIWPPSTTSV